MLTFFRLGIFLFHLKYLVTKCLLSWKENRTLIKENVTQPTFNKASRAQPLLAPQCTLRTWTEFNVQIFLTLKGDWSCLWRNPVRQKRGGQQDTVKYLRLWNAPLTCSMSLSLPVFDCGEEDITQTMDWELGYRYVGYRCLVFPKHP